LRCTHSQLRRAVADTHVRVRALFGVCRWAKATRDERRATLRRTLTRWRRRWAERVPVYRRGDIAVLRIASTRRRVAWRRWRVRRVRCAALSAVQTVAERVMGVRRRRRALELFHTACAVARHAAGVACALESITHRLLRKALLKRWRHMLRVRRVHTLLAMFVLVGPLVRTLARWRSFHRRRRLSVLACHRGWQARCRTPLRHWRRVHADERRDRERGSASRGGGGAAGGWSLLGAAGGVYESNATCFDEASSRLLRRTPTRAPRATDAAAHRPRHVVWEEDEPSAGDVLSPPSFIVESQVRAAQCAEQRA
jgi:hypothetical protein